MAEQFFDLGANPFAANSDWEGSYLIDPSLVAGGATAYLRRIGESGGGSCQIDTSSTASGSYTGAGPELIPEWENLVNAIVFTADDGGITLKGPNHPDNSFRDPTEPYFWTPDNNTDFRDWIVAEPRNVIVRFNLAAVAPPSAEAVAFDAAAGQPTAAFNLAAVAPLLVLADSDDTGLDVVAKALLVASDAATTGNFFYEDADRGGTDTPLDGELGLGDDETLISGFRRQNSHPSATER